MKLLLSTLASAVFVSGFSSQVSEVPSGLVEFGRAGCVSKIASSATTKPMVGGMLYVTKAASPTKWTQIIDLGDTAIAAGCSPKHKPHMVIPSPDGKFVAITYAGDTFVHIMDATTKQIVMCIDGTAPAPGVKGGAMHTASWFGDKSILVCDMMGSVDGIAGGAIQKYENLDFANGAYDFAAALPMGSIIDGEIMSVVAEIPLADFSPCKGGGLWVEPHPEDPAIVIAQYGTQDEGSVTPECLFKIDMSKAGSKAKAVTKTYLLPPTADDTHGLQFCKNTSGDFHLVITNRASSTLDVLDYVTGEVVVSGFDLNPGQRKILQPDVIYLAYDKTLFIAARGPMPVSAVKPQNFLPDATAGVFILQLTECIDPVFAQLSFLLTDLDRSIIPSDVHGLWGVGNEIWVVDQAATGSTVSLQA